MGDVLLTGATGFLGMELLVRLLAETDAEIVTPVRARDDAAAGDRMASVLHTLLPPQQVTAARDRIRAVAADLEQPRLGWDAARADAVARDVATVVHCAASVSFALPLEDARRINVGGTTAVLDLAARAPRLERLVHVSTAYVAGDREGICREEDGDLGQTHRNTYEKSKLEAEGLVARSGLPHATLRPSIVVGDSRTGWTPAFNVIYWPLQAFARGLFDVVPGDPAARADIVPIDTVADALFALTTGERRTGTIHVVAGDGAATAGDLSRLACAAFGATPPRFVGAGEAPQVEELAGAYLPYFRVRGIFDGGRGHALGFRPPALDDYFGALMAYARTARWGKRPQPRWAVADGVAAAA